MSKIISILFVGTMLFTACGVAVDEVPADEVSNVEEAVCDGFVMFDGNCYAVGENIPETDCIVSATGGCEAIGE